MSALPVNGRLDVIVAQGLMGLVILGVLHKDVVQVVAVELVQLVLTVEDHQGDLAVTKDAELVSFLHQPELPLGERHLTVPLVHDALDAYFLSSHC